MPFSFLNSSHPDSFFPQAERSRLVYDLLMRARYKQEPEDKFAIGVERLVSEGVFSAVFPLHEVCRAFFMETVAWASNVLIAPG
jgi:hypothetical protein